MFRQISCTHWKWLRHHSGRAHMSRADLGASNVQVNTRRHKVLAAGDGLLRQSVPGETLLYKVTGDDTDGALDIFLLSIQPKSGPPLHIHHQQHETIYFM